MGKIIIEYKPELSDQAQKIIADDISYSMISIDEESRQYDIMMCIDALEYYDDLYDKDVQLLYALSQENVSYIEF